MNYKKLEELLDYEQPNDYIVENNKYDDKYKTPVLTAGQSFILGYTNEENNIFRAKKNPVIIFDDFTTSSKYVDFDFKVKSSAMKILKAKNGVNTKYVFYLMQTIKFDNQLHKRYWISEYSKIKVPIPNIEIQNEIVRKLDLVTKIVSNKTEQLQELNQLIKSQFVEMFENANFERKTLQEITTKITDGSHNPPSGISENSGYLMLSSQNVINDKINYDNARFLSKEDFEKESTRTNLKRGDVLLTIVGTVGRTAIITDEENITLQRSVAVLKPVKEIKSEYLVGALKSDDVVKQLNKGAKGVAQKGIYLNDLKKLIIPIPPIELQNKFAEFVKQIDKQKFEIQKSLEEIQVMQDNLMNTFFGG